MFIGAVYLRLVIKMYRYRLYECVSCPYSHAMSFAAADMSGRKVSSRSNVSSKKEKALQGVIFLEGMFIFWYHSFCAIDREMMLRICAQFLGSLTFYHVFMVSVWDIGLTSLHERRLVHSSHHDCRLGWLSVRSASYNPE